MLARKITRKNGFGTSAPRLWPALARAALLAVVLLGLMGSPQEGAAQSGAPPRRYRIIDLGTLGGTDSRAYGVNNKGQVVGEAFGGPADPFGYGKAFVWTGGAMSGIAGVTGGSYTYSGASAINNNGKVVGIFDPSDETGNPPTQLFLYDISTGSLTFPLSPGSGVDINDAGQILAFRPSPSGVWSAVILGSSGMTDLGALFGEPFAGKKINASGFVVGGPAQPPNHLNGYLYDGSFVPISGSVGFYGFAINDANQIAGSARQQTQFYGIRVRAALRQPDGTIQIFGSFNVNGDASASAINNLGQIVGTEYVSSVRIPFLIENGVMMNINSLLPANSGWLLRNANDINDRGEIVGSGRINNEEHAFLLTPLICTAAEDTDGDGNADNDGDGLCDSWEVSGVDSDGDGIIDLNLAALGADLNHKDIFVEIDYMDCTGSGSDCTPGDTHSHRLPDFDGDGIPESLVEVFGAFFQAPVANPDGFDGVTLRLEGGIGGVDEAVPHSMEVDFPQYINSNCSNNVKSFDDLKIAHFGTVAERASANAAKILAAKALVFHYVIFAHRKSDNFSDTDNDGIPDTCADNFSGGVAELPGNDLIVALGRPLPGPGNRWANDAQTLAQAWGTSFGQEWTDLEAATFMHELGHNLNLHHGGFEDRNCKPNYLSIMSYGRQLNNAGRPVSLPGAAGLDTDGDGVVDRVRLNRPIDYSRGQLPTLDPPALDETVGLQGPPGARMLFGGDVTKWFVGPSSGGIDWDTDGMLEPSVDLAIQFVAGKAACSSLSSAPLTSWDDWQNILFDFRQSTDFEDGVHLTPALVEPEQTDVEYIDGGLGDPDFDSDGILNAVDNCPLVSNPSQTDSNGDGIGNACEAITALDADMNVSKSGPATITLGSGNITYTVVVTNNGPTDATNVVLTDTLPVGVTFVSVSPTGPVCTQAGGTVTCNLGGLVNGGSATVTIVVTPTAAGTLTNTASVSAAEPDPATGDNTATATTTVTPSADLSVTKTDLPDPVNVNANLTYTITVTNNGPSSATSASLSDVLPAGVNFVSLTSPAGWTCTTPAAGANGTVSCTNPSVGSGVSGVFTLVVTPTAVAAASISNTATVSATTSDPNSANNSQTIPTAVNPVADLAITKTDTPDPVSRGSNITYTITVTNNGPSAATGVAVTDTVPANVTFVSATGSGVVTCAQAGGVITCNVGTLASGASASATVVVTATATGTVTNTVNVTSSTTDPSAANNSATATTTVTPPPATDFSLALVPVIREVRAGGTATYVATLTPIPANTLFNTAIGISCFTNLLGATCTAAPGSVTPGINPATSTISVTIPQGSVAPGAPRGPQPPVFHPWLLPLFGAMLAAYVLLSLRCKRRWMERGVSLALLLFALALAIGQSGCAKAGEPPIAPYMLTVTATSGSLSHSATATVNVVK